MNFNKSGGYYGEFVSYNNIFWKVLAIRLLLPHSFEFRYTPVTDINFVTQSEVGHNIRVAESFTIRSFSIFVYRNGCAFDISAYASYQDKQWEKAYYKCER